MSELCMHDEVVDVTTLGGEKVAALCTGCDQQLEAEWEPGDYPKLRLKNITA